jgi:hypothetical protein
LSNNPSDIKPAKIALLLFLFPVFTLGTVLVTMLSVDGHRVDQAFKISFGGIKTTNKIFLKKL